MQNPDIIIILKLKVLQCSRHPILVVGDIGSGSPASSELEPSLVQWARGCDSLNSRGVPDPVPKELSKPNRAVHSAYCISTPPGLLSYIVLSESTPCLNNCRGRLEVSRPTK